MSPSNYRPSLPSGGADGAGASLNGAPEAVGPTVESQLSAHSDISAARQFFQPTGTEAAGIPHLVPAGTETSALAAKAIALPGALPGAESAVLASAAGHASIGAAAVAGAAEISPMIQLIMRLPGAMGVTTSFFEWLQNLFMPTAALTDAFNPLLWAQLGAQIKASIAGIGAHGIGMTSEHLPISLSLLPGHAPIFQQIGMHQGMSFEVGKSLPGGLPQVNLRDQLNVSGTLDLKKPQFEMGQSGANAGAARADGILSGASINDNLNPAQLAGTERIFSDKIGIAQSASSNMNTSVVSSTVTPVNGAASGTSHLNVVSQGQEAGSINADYQIGSGIVSGPSLSNNIGYQLSGSGPASLDSAPTLSPSGAVSDKLGSQQLMANNMGAAPTYRPSMGGYYKTSAPLNMDSSPVGQEAASSLTPLKAEALSLLKKVKPVSTSVPTKSVMDHVGHQAKSGHAGSATNGMDQVAHHSTPAHPQAHHQSSHSTVHKAEAPKPRVEQPKTVQRVEQPAASEVEQATPAPEVANQTVGADGAQNYSVQSGDNLWDIARKQLGDGSRWQEIYRLNTDAIGANPNLIHTGLDLKMPGAEIAKAPDAAAAQPYTVQHGDNLWDIAEKQLGDGSRWGEIYKANTAVIGDNPRLIFAGQELQMPGADTLVSQADPSATAGFAQGGATASMPQGMAQPGADPGFVANSMPQTNVQPVSQAMPNREMPVGPGAAAAATIDPSLMVADDSVVSSSLAPDLSFLYNKQGN
ncbi:MAG: LysM peptidoglycan-binding domain-containing protein [Candidatus Obscuribacterales bacterium]|nr:LysM peptidoglycan-binding domain-containing protein [Candidatus Obscuribacterales bacterium]